MSWYQTLLVVAGAIAALGVIWKSPIGTAVRWLLRRNVVTPLRSASKSLITETVQPMVDDIKANARAQHDEQNMRLDQITDRLDGHGRRLSLIEDHITRPRGH